MSLVDTTNPSPFSPGTADGSVPGMEPSGTANHFVSSFGGGSVACTPAAMTSPEARHENRLAIVRLGMATSLYTALRAKHFPTASHSLRVAVACAAWADRLRFNQEHRDRLEVASLLHDVGKIGIPDQVLRKPGKLSLEEQLTMSLSPRLGVEILRACCADEVLLKTVLHTVDWYGGRPDQSLVGEELPLGSRMIAVSDAFDSMTTDSVYRPAMSREAAFAQLLEGAGTQFDPDLVNDFVTMMEQSAQTIHRQVLIRWLQTPAEPPADSRWVQSPTNGFSFNDSARHDEQSHFHDQLLSGLEDAVVYVDRDGIIRRWNHVAEQMTSISASAVLMNDWSASLFGLHGRNGVVNESECPVRQALTSGTVASGRYVVQRTDGRSIPVAVTATPVRSNRPGLCGVVFIVRDTSQQKVLEERVESLHHQVNHDGLTKVANRAAFDRELESLVTRNHSTGATFSLIICDIDHFKRVNDLYGHPAGDEALVSFAAVLSANSREHDLVSRYGGEEFVLLAPECDIATATRRAEKIRQAVEVTPLKALGNNPVTASFGVTEVQPGDTAESVLARADRALLQAKDSGRNQVIQLGVGTVPEGEMRRRRRSLFSWFESSQDAELQDVEITTPVPVNFAIEKLRGFVADHKAEIVSVTEGDLKLKMKVFYGSQGRRSADGYMTFGVHIRLVEKIKTVAEGSRQRPQLQTHVFVSLQPLKTKDRRSKEVSTCANQIILSVKSYLMGRIESE